MAAIPLPLADAPPTLPALLELSPADLKTWLAERHQPPMRAKQIRRWVLAARATSFDQMTDLPKGLREELAGSFSLFGTRVAKHLESSDGTHKLLLKLTADALIECVLIQDARRATACISTQVGCGMGCVFCASGLNGVARNLTVGEMVEQLVRQRNLTKTEDLTPRPPLRRGEGVFKADTQQPTFAIAPERSRVEHPLSASERGPGGEVSEPTATRLTHIVVMGMGEPLANLDNLLAALAIAGEKDGLGIGQRHITVSTVGLPAKIRALADKDLQYHLAISLHAPNDTLRTEIVPTNSKTGIPDILAAADYFFEKTGRQVTYEYVVLGGLNDGPTHAKELARLLAGRKAHVNLIPWNEVDGLPFRRPDDDDLRAFIDSVRKAGISVKVRKRKGADIDAACGQLRRSAERGAANAGLSSLTTDH
jgi:23S rRNA (adenine2503-C2)-methyltransferase